jgi:hypothetical protein
VSGIALVQHHDLQPRREQLVRDQRSGDARPNDGDITRQIASQTATPQRRRREFEPERFPSAKIHGG